MYYLFAGSSYYPYGGMGDYVGQFSTVSEACAAAGTPGGAFSWYEVMKATPAGLERVIRREVYFSSGRTPTWTDV